MKLNTTPPQLEVLLFLDFTQIVLNCQLLCSE